MGQDKVLYDYDKFTGLFAHMPSGVAIYTAVDEGENFIFDDLNPAAEKIEGLRRSDVIGKPVDVVFPGARQMGIIEALRRVWDTGRAEFFPKAVYGDSRISNSWRENWIYKLRTGEVVAIYNDVTARVKAEEETANQNHLFKNVISNIPYAIFWKDRNSVYLGCNEYFARSLGVGKPENIIGKSDYDLPLVKEEVDIFIGDDKRVMDSGVPILNAERVQKLPDGREATLLINKLPLRDSKGVIFGVMGIYADITDRKRAEVTIRKAYEDLKKLQSDLVQSEKMAAIGRFSAGIAHEVKNPLAIVVGCAELLENKLPHYDIETMDTLEKIKGAALTANSTLMSLLQYSRPSELKVKRITAQDLIYGVLPLFEKNAQKAGIEIVKEFGPDAIRVMVDKEQMHHVIFNILKNAIESMPTGGRLTISIYKAVVPEFSSSYKSCVIEIKDTGSGISKEDISKITEPFFSTKDRVSGTGLGLFMAKSILDKHNARLLVDSESGRGTAMKIVLPLAKDE